MHLNGGRHAFCPEVADESGHKREFPNDNAVYHVEGSLRLRQTLQRFQLSNAISQIHFAQRGIFCCVNCSSGGSNRFDNKGCAGGKDYPRQCD